MNPCDITHDGKSLDSRNNSRLDHRVISLPKRFFLNFAINSPKFNERGYLISLVSYTTVIKDDRLSNSLCNKRTTAEKAVDGRLFFISSSIGLELK